MFRIYNHKVIEQRGGFLCGNDDFHIVQCTTCGCQYLYNNEMIHLYHNPDDLSQVTYDIEGQHSLACRCCGKHDWDFEELGENDEQKVKQGPWAWLTTETDSN